MIRIGFFRRAFITVVRFVVMMRMAAVTVIMQMAMRPQRVTSRLDLPCSGMGMLNRHDDLGRQQERDQE
ncbi:hypothetical protein [Rubinisphaera margarita]|uniref:hypothetical protein n=1 Tax=Rubinisphaera margarita TaxID=2909586 RepID=UPI001EE83315|nr:hypothetical protein [Rubinisphaera margarita]MCG6156372.1 hypothetical protein [Rubinisphaera margarita]